MKATLARNGSNIFRYKNMRRFFIEEKFHTDLKQALILSISEAVACVLLNFNFTKRTL